MYNASNHQQNETDILENHEYSVLQLQHTETVSQNYLLLVSPSFPDFNYLLQLSTIVVSNIKILYCFQQVLYPFALLF